jgi:tellurite methyltransferase
MADLQKKWDAIYRQRESSSTAPAFVLSNYSYLLPKKGRALDLACGLGGNSFFLANHGLQVDAWDISPVAIERINKNASISSLINASTVDISSAQVEKNHYDVIVVSRYLNRLIVPQLIDALRPGGLIFYQTFTLEKAQLGGPTNPDFLLKKNELLALFSSLSVIIYHEEVCLGDTKLGFRNEALLIAEKS